MGCCGSGGDKAPPVKAAPHRARVGAVVKAGVNTGAPVHERIAKQLYKAVKGFGCNTQAIYESLTEVQSKEVWAAVKAHFKKQHRDCNDGDLTGALYEALNPWDLHKAKAKLRRNNVHYDADDSARLPSPGDIIELVGEAMLDPTGRADYKSTRGGRYNAAQYRAFEAWCEVQSLQLTVRIEKELLPDDPTGSLVMVDAMMHTGPGILVISAAERRAAKETPGVMVQIGGKVMEARETFLRHIGMESNAQKRLIQAKLHKVEDYSERKQSIPVSLRRQRIVRFIVTWEYSTAGTLVTLATGEDKPYHAEIRLWLEGGHVIWGDRQDYGVRWVVKTGKAPKPAETRAAFFDGVAAQCSVDGAHAPANGVPALGQVAAAGGRPRRVGEFGKDKVVMLDVMFRDADEGGGPGPAPDQAPPGLTPRGRLEELNPCNPGINVDQLCLVLGVTADEARKLLHESGGSVNRAMELHLNDEQRDAAAGPPEPPRGDSAEAQAAALAARVPRYETYAAGKDRAAFAEPLTARWAAPTLSQLFCGLYQLADVSYGPPAYFEGYHPRKMNCQAFVFDVLIVLLTPAQGQSFCGPVVNWFPVPQATKFKSQRGAGAAGRGVTLDGLPTVALLRALKPHLMQDADALLCTGGSCQLGELAEKVADWLMF